jgi:enoyl-CoA hydratase/carnithine racemase
VLYFCKCDDTHRMTLCRVAELTEIIRRLDGPIVFSGSERFFSAGADLNEIAPLNASNAMRFASQGQRLMSLIDRHPAPVIAAISGYCMGGGLDLALACDFRIAAPNAILGHRGAALGIMTGWGGTQRLPRLVGRSRALYLFLTAEKLDAETAFRWGLVDRVASDPVRAAIEYITP